MALENVQGEVQADTEHHPEPSRLPDFRREKERQQQSQQNQPQRAVERREKPISAMVVGEQKKEETTHVGQDGSAQ